MSKYFTYNNNDGEYEFFDTEKEAITWCEEIINDIFGDEFSEEDINGQIGWGEIKQESFCDIIAKKEDFTTEEWEEKGYSSDYDFIANGILKDIKEAQENE